MNKIKARLLRLNADDLLFFKLYIDQFVFYTLLLQSQGSLSLLLPSYPSLSEPRLAIQLLVLGHVDQDRAGHLFAGPVLAVVVHELPVRID